MVSSVGSTYGETVQPCVVRVSTADDATSQGGMIDDSETVPPPKDRKVKATLLRLTSDETRKLASTGEPPGYLMRRLQKFSTRLPSPIS